MAFLLTAVCAEAPTGAPTTSDRTTTNICLFMMRFFMVRENTVHGNSIREPRFRLTQGAKRLQEAESETLVGVDDRLCVEDRFEAGFHLEIESEGSILRRMRRVGLEIETTARGCIGADTLNDPPGLSKFACELENAVNLVAAGESTAVEENVASGSFFEQEAGGFEHDLHYKIVLLDGIFDILRCKKSGADLVFAEQRSLRTVGQSARECCLAGAWKPGHQNHHC